MPGTAIRSHLLYTLGDMAADFCLDSAICASCEVEMLPLKGWGPFIATNTTALIEKAKGPQVFESSRCGCGDHHEF